MKKKSLISMLAALSLTATVMVGATLAYLTDETGEVTNTFTIGNVDIELTEPKWEEEGEEEAKDMLPGAEADKNPLITNTGAADGYMLLKISGMTDMEAMGFLALTDGVAGYNTADWVLVDENGKPRTDNPTNKLVDGYYVYKKGAVASAASSSSLFTHIKLDEKASELTNRTYKVVGEIQVDANGDVVPDATGKPVVKFRIDGIAATPSFANSFDTYEAAEAYVLENYKDAATYVFDLTVQGYSIQSKGFELATEGEYTWVKEFGF